MYDLDGDFAEPDKDKTRSSEGEGREDSPENQEVVEPYDLDIIPLSEPIAERGNPPKMPCGGFRL